MYLNDQTNVYVSRRSFTNTNASEEYEIICSNKAIHVVYSDTVYRQIAEILFKNGLIDHVFILRTDNTFSIWTSLKKYDKESRYSLYRQELEIIKYFSPVEFHFDFHMADPQDAKELLFSGAKRLFQKK